LSFFVILGVGYFGITMDHPFFNFTTQLMKLYFHHQTFLLNFFLLLLFSVSLSIRVLPAQKSCLQIDEAYGAYDVGFKVLHTFDHSRSFLGIQNNAEKIDEGIGFRPMQIAIWYPAKAKQTDTHINYEDYFYLKAHETGEVIMTDQVKLEIIKEFMESDPVAQERFNQEMKLPVMAYLNADPATGKFPLMIYGPSWWSTSFENALLFEFLASHGYIILSSPSMGPEIREMPLSAIGMETQARDMEFLLAKAAELPSADLGKVAVAGFSWGGLSNVIMASRHKGVDAWIGLDPSVHEAYDLFEKTPYNNYSNFTMPTLFVNSASYIHSTAFLDSLLHSEAYMVNLPTLEHTDLASQFIQLMGSEQVEEGKLTNQNKGYNIMCRAIIDFLDYHFKGKKPDFFDSLRNDYRADDGFVGFVYKKALPLPEELVLGAKNSDTSLLHQYLTNSSGSPLLKYPAGEIHQLLYLLIEAEMKTLASQLLSWHQKIYPNAFPNQMTQWVEAKNQLKVFAEIYRTNTPCTFSYDDINHTGHIFFLEKKGEKGIQYFELNEKLHPDHFKAQFNLGLGYYWLKQNKKAQIHFQKCLDLNPDQRYGGMAKNFLAELKE
jgi:pimeloyl-ACP methyl ester carboxylesterase